MYMYIIYKYVCVCIYIYICLISNNISTQIYYNKMIIVCKYVTR